MLTNGLNKDIIDITFNNGGMNMVQTMQLSELIKKLQELHAKHGEAEVYCDTVKGDDFRTPFTDIGNGGVGFFDTGEVTYYVI